MNERIVELFRADQAERIHHPVCGTAAYRALRERDALRRKEVLGIMATSGIDDGENMFQAAMILQHGDEAEEVWQAHRLARAAADAGHRPGRWLAAASLDRWLMYQGKPQKFGTNIVPDGRRQRLWDVDPGTTDEERAQWDVPRLAEMVRRAEELTRSEPMPPMDAAPRWLTEAIRRWYPGE